MNENFINIDIYFVIIKYGFRIEQSDPGRIRTPHLNL